MKSSSTRQSNSFPKIHTKCSGSDLKDEGIEMTVRIGVFKCLLHVSSDLPQLTICVEHTLAEANYRSCYPPHCWIIKSVRERPTGSPLAALTSTLGLLSAGSFQKTCGNITPVTQLPQVLSHCHKTNKIPQGQKQAVSSFISPLWK